jgi:hypothetical protein
MYLNYHKILIFNLQQQNWIVKDIQLSKPDKFDHSSGFKSSFVFFLKNYS